MTLRAYGRLLRLSLAPSAIADMSAGIVIGTGGAWLTGSAPWLLIAASIGVYHGALALNDWADHEGDARTRPDRPIPSGAVSARSAVLLGLLLVTAGALAAWSVHTNAGVAMTIVACLAVGYDLAGRGPWLGPTLLGLCRFGNFSVGLMAPLWLAGKSAELPFFLTPAILYGGYVFSISRLGRLEDDEDSNALGARPKRYLIWATFCLIMVPFSYWETLTSGGWTGFGLSAFVAWSGAAGLVLVALRTEEWTRELVGQCMGMALRRLLVFTAACALLVTGPGWTPAFVAGCILAGYPLSFALRKVFPPS